MLRRHVRAHGERHLPRGKAHYGHVRCSLEWQSRWTGVPSTNIEVQVRCEAKKDREQCRTSAPNDLREPRRLDETRRPADLGHSSDGPSWIDLAVIRVNKTESRFEASLNPLLQQNLP